jgi:hypothetical protein
MPMAESSKVEVSRTTLLALVASLSLCLLVVAFMLGRQSAPVAQAPSPTPTVSVVAASTPSSPLAVTDVQSAPAPPEPAPVAAAPPPPAPEPVPAAPAPEITPNLPRNDVPLGVTTLHRHRPAMVQSAPMTLGVSPHHKSAGNQVAAYLNRVDAIMASTGELGDPTQMANSVLGQGAQGDSSGFDDLISKTRAAQQALGSVVPPGPCKEHYHLMVEQLQGSLALLQQVKSATVGMDAKSLPALASQGQKMQAGTLRLQQLTARLRQRYQ